MPIEAIFAVASSQARVVLLDIWSVTNIVDVVVAGGLHLHSGHAVRRYAQVVLYHGIKSSKKIESTFDILYTQNKIVW
jgi:hypothetical protein